MAPWSVIKNQQIFIFEVPGTVLKKNKKCSLGHFFLLEWKHYHVLFVLKIFGTPHWSFFPSFTWMHLGMEMNVELVSLFQLSRV